MAIENTSRGEFERIVQGSSLQQIKSIVKEIYEAKNKRGRNWEEPMIIKVERFESYCQKILKAKNLLTKGDNIEYNTYIKSLRRW